MSQPLYLLALVLGLLLPHALGSTYSISGTELTIRNTDDGCRYQFNYYKSSDFFAATGKVVVPGANCRWKDLFFHSFFRDEVVERRPILSGPHISRGMTFENSNQPVDLVLPLEHIERKLVDGEACLFLNYVEKNVPQRLTYCGLSIFNVKFFVHRLEASGEETKNWVARYPATHYVKYPTFKVVQNCGSKKEHNINVNKDLTIYFKQAVPKSILPLKLHFAVIRREDDHKNYRVQYFVNPKAVLQNIKNGCVTVPYRLSQTIPKNYCDKGCKILFLFKRGSSLLELNSDVFRTK
jgi:hypothetical protein